MKSTCTLLALVLTSSVACSDPDCLPSEVKVGTQCRARRSDADAGTSQSESPTGEAHFDASTVDGPDEVRDATTGVADTSAPDAMSVATEQADAGATMTPTTQAPVCGDGTLNGTELCDPAIVAGSPGACMQSDACTSSNRCIVASLTGTPDACNVRCETTQVVNCKSGDGCCPAGCNKSNDNDCSASCGNGYVDSGETCEPGIGKGCPTSCTPPNSCTNSTLTGSAANCDAACAETPKLADKTKSDGCCPPGANANTDSDCKAVCNNGIVEPGETCDGNCPSCDDGTICTADSSTGDAATCNLVCSHTPRAASRISKDSCCPPGATATTDLDCAGCGNYTIEGAEQCDDGNVNSGDLCDSTCRLENNPATPGDDRAGYLACEQQTCTTAQGCSRETTSPYRWLCNSTGFDGFYCDGPEDCPQGQRCGIDAKVKWAVCATRADDDANFGILCHASKDCPTGKVCKANNLFAACAPP